VIKQNAGQRARLPQRGYLAAIDQDFFSSRDLLPEGRYLAVDGDPARAYPLLNFPARANTRPRKHLLQALCAN
jgi:hypothetical protein